MGTLLSVREKNWFFSSAPSWPLAVTIGIDAIVIFVIATVGIPPLNVQPIFYGWVLAAILAALITALIDDCLKVSMYKIFRAISKRSKSKTKKNSKKKSSKNNSV
jgi:hypothetical protein